MTIREFAYAVQRHLQSKTGSAFKRAHVCELLAAAFGFDSYAAFRCAAVLAPRRPGGPRQSPQYSPLIRTRCVALGYAPATADAASTELPGFVAQRQLDVVPFSDLVATLRDGSWRWGDDQYWGEPDDDGDEMPAPTWSVLDGEEISTILLDGLESAASTGNALAHYALALIHAPSENEDDKRGVGSPYWYSQEQQGRVLIGVEKEWADAHARHLRTAELYALHLREAARLGNDDALLDLAERFDAPTFFEKPHRSAMEDPAKVAEIAERLGRTEDARKWLAIAAEAGDIEAMRQLIEGYDCDDPQQCWMWVYLAQLVGTDLTRDEYCAIHEDGSPYDYDVGGTVSLGGRGGVELDSLDAAKDAAARYAAKQRFKELERAG